MMRPTKLSAKVFLELPPVLAHYLEGGRNVWLESVPSKGKLSLVNRPGVFVDIEALAVERKQLVEILGLKRARALRYRTGFEQGRREAARHFAVYAQNARLALQAGPVFGQLQGRFIAESVKFEFDLGERTLYRELVLQQSAEGISHRVAFEDCRDCACWTVAGYLSGQVSEIVGRHVVTLETECCAKGDAHCRFISRLESEWDGEADWVRQAIQMEPLEDELRRLSEGAPVIAPVAVSTPKADADEQPENGHAATTPVELLTLAEPEPGLEGYVADSAAMAPVVKRFRHLKDTDVPMLLTGEAGTGRQTLARLLHKASRRAEGPFVALDCIGLADEHLTQELFGYVQGAFPGATRNHTGALARAHGGTLFLDEVANLSLEAQGRLARAMEEHAVMPLGATEAAPADVRIIAATQHDPHEKMTKGELREDLYYALSVARLSLPPLRERGTDILRLAEAFLQEFRGRYHKDGARLSDAFKQVLLECAWPGNVTQLRNVIEHAVVMGDGQDLSVEDLPEEVLATRWKRAPQELSEQVIRAALSRTNGNRSHAADLLGVGRTTLWRAMKRLGLE